MANVSLPSIMQVNKGGWAFKVWERLFHPGKIRMWAAEAWEGNFLNLIILPRYNLDNKNPYIFYIYT